MYLLWLRTLSDIIFVRILAYRQHFGNEQAIESVTTGSEYFLPCINEDFIKEDAIETRDF